MGWPLEERHEGGGNVLEIDCHVHWWKRVVLYHPFVLLSAMFASGSLCLVSFVLTSDNLKLPGYGKVNQYMSL